MKFIFKSIIAFFSILIVAGPVFALSQVIYNPVIKGTATFTGSTKIINETRAINLTLGSVSATTKYNILVPKNTTVSGFSFIGSTAVTANDTNYWTFSVTNKGASGSGSTALLAATNANTTKATGGFSLAENVEKKLSLTSTIANRNLIAGDVIEVVITKAASATTIDAGTFILKTTDR